MTENDKPRRFFGLLCAHEWFHSGTLKREWVSGRTQSLPVLTCKHCGDMKTMRP